MKSNNNGKLFLFIMYKEVPSDNSFGGNGRYERTCRRAGIPKTHQQILVSWLEGCRSRMKIIVSGEMLTMRCDRPACLIKNFAMIYNVFKIQSLMEHAQYFNFFVAQQHHKFAQIIDNDI